MGVRFRNRNNVLWLNSLYSRLGIWLAKNTFAKRQARIRYMKSDPG